jgi:hypothetical protein
MPLWERLSAAIDRAVNGVAIAAKAAPTKTMLQLDDRRISLMNYLALYVDTRRIN